MAIDVRSGLNWLNSRCDGAREQDGVGFNKFDTKRVDRLLADHEWSERQELYAGSLIRKYRGQLEKDHGQVNDVYEDVDFEWDRLEGFAENGQQISDIIEVRIESNCVVFDFEYGCEDFNEIKDIIKQAPSSWFDKEGHDLWRVFDASECKDVIRDLHDKFENRISYRGDLEELNRREQESEESEGDESKSSHGKPVEVSERDGVYWVEFVGSLDNFTEVKDAVKFAGANFEGKDKGWKYENGILDLVDALEEYEDQVHYSEDVQDAIEEAEELVELSNADDAEVEEPEGFNDEYELLDFQRAGVAYSGQKKRAIIADEMGLGKAQPVDEKVLTPEGWVEIGSIEQGDQVIGSDGDSISVNGVYPQGRRDIYEVTFSDGVSVECDLEHLWAVQTKNDRFRNPDNYRVKELSEIIDEGLRDGAGNRKWFLPLVDPVSFESKDLYLEPYLVGALLGDGTLSIDHRVKFSTGDSEVIERLNGLLPDPYFFSKKSGCDYVLERGEGSDKNPILDTLRNLGLKGLTSEDKFIPDLYKYSKVNQRVKLLQGLLDTDGSFHGSAFTFSSASERLTDDLREVILSLGGTASKYVGGTVGKDRYRLYARLPDQFEPFQLERKLEAIKNPQDRSPVRSIDSIEYVGEKEAVCISVDSDDELYVTRNHVLTHNTVQALTSVELNDAYPVLYIVPASVKVNWKRESNKFLPGREVYVLEGQDGDLPDGYDSYVINYDILSHRLDQLKSVDWEAITCDEIHYCFPYEEQVLTDRGYLPIGRIVEEGLDVSVLSCDTSSNELSLNQVTSRFKKRSQESLVEVQLSDGRSVSCTPGHRFFVEGRGYVRADQLGRGTELSLVRSDVRSEGVESEVLFRRLSEGGLQGKQEGETDNEDEGVRLVWGGDRGYSSFGRREEVLRRELFSEVEDGSRGNQGEDLHGREVRESIRITEGNGSSRCVRENGKAESGPGVSRESYEGASEVEGGEPVLHQRETFDGRETKYNGASGESLRSIRVERGEDGVCSGYGFSKVSGRDGEYGEVTSGLLRRFSLSRSEISNRSGWSQSRDQGTEVGRQTAGEGIERVRVESVEVQERGDSGGSGQGGGGDQFVYDLEVENNHNYFVNGVLVSNCKSHDAKRTQALLDLTEETDPEVRLGLSGTPFKNRPKELIQPLEFLDRLDELGGWYNFVKTYCEGRKVNKPWGSYWELDGSDNLGELHDKLRRSCMVRRTKEDVLDELPQKRRSIVPIEIDRDDYERKEEEIVEEAQRRHQQKLDDLQSQIQDLKSRDDLSGEEQDELDKLEEEHRNLRQSGPALQLSLLTKLRKYVGEAKIKHAKQWIEDALDSGELIVFAHHKKVIKELYDEFEDRAVVLDGDTPEDQRQQVVDDFQNDPDVKLFIGQAQASGEGITLTEAKQVAFLEPLWTPSEHEQCEARAYARMNDAHGINSYFLVAEDTLDDDILELVEGKREDFERAFDAGEREVESSFDKRDLQQEVLDRILERQERVGVA